MNSRILIAIAGLLLIAGACEDDHFIDSPNYTIHGSGDLISEPRRLPQFNSLEINTAAEVQLSRGGNQQVIVTVDDNVMEYITTRVYDGMLQVSSRSNVSISDFSLSLHITIPELAGVAVNGVATVISEDNFNPDILFLTMNGVGNIGLSIAAGEVFSANNSVGTIDLRGTAVTHYAAVSSVGPIMAYDLVTDTTLASVNSVGNAYVRADDFLRATIGSTGSIYYRGYPEIQLLDNGAGRLIDAN
jgi:hypothetical protein